MRGLVIADRWRRNIEIEGTSLEPVEKMYYAIVWVVRLPRPQLLDEPECMLGGKPWWRRLVRQLVPRRACLDCCWYHRGDWHKVSKIAIRHVRAARRDGIASDDFHDHVWELAAVEDMTDWEREALWSLLFDHIEVDRCAGDYVNGPHRSQAMLDAGVRRTIVLTWRRVPAPG